MIVSELDEKKITNQVRNYFKIKHIIFLLVIFSMTSIGLYGQGKIVIDDSYKCSVGIDSINGQKIFEFVDKLPEYIGGDKAFIKFIYENLKYPTVEFKSDLQTKLMLTFVIDSSGNATNICVSNPKYADRFTSMEKEAMRVLSIMPKWIPGELRGKKVPVRFFTPINIDPKY